MKGGKYETRNIHAKIITFACQRLVSNIFFLLTTIITCAGQDAGVHTYRILQTDFAASVISYLKFTSGMNISEHRRPQVEDRKFEFQQ